MKIPSNPYLHPEGEEPQLERPGTLRASADGQGVRYQPSSGPIKDVSLQGESVLKVVSGPAKEHEIVHNLNRRNLIWTVQIDDSGEPGEYVLVRAIPTPGDELNKISVSINSNEKLHFNILI